MTVLTSFEFKGDPDQLLKDKNEKVDPIFMDVAPDKGFIAHMVARSDDGLVVFNVWESLEASEKVADIVRPQAMALGLPAPTNWKVYELVQREGALAPTAGSRS